MIYAVIRKNGHRFSVRSRAKYKTPITIRRSCGDPARRNDIPSVRLEKEDEDASDARIKLAGAKNAEQKHLKEMDWILDRLDSETNESGPGSNFSAGDALMKRPS